MFQINRHSTNNNCSCKQLEVFYECSYEMKIKFYCFKKFLIFYKMKNILAKNFKVYSKFNQKSIICKQIKTNLAKAKFYFCSD